MLFIFWEYMYRMVTRFLTIEFIFLGAWPNSVILFGPKGMLQFDLANITNYNNPSIFDYIQINMNYLYKLFGNMLDKIINYSLIRSKQLFDNMFDKINFVSISVYVC